MKVELRLPPIAAEDPPVTVDQVMVSPGDLIEQDDVYMVVSTDKVCLDVPSLQSGRIVEVAVSAGEIKKAGDLLLIVDTDDAPAAIARGKQAADVRIALDNLAAIDPVHLCSRPKLGALNFASCLTFVEETVSLAWEFRNLPFKRLDEPLIKELQKAIFLVSSLVRLLREFDPNGVTATREHAKITQAVQDDQEKAVRLFHEVLWRAGGTVGYTSAVDKSEGFDPGGAWVFISYSHHDQGFALQLASHLRAEHIGHFFDHHANEEDLVNEPIHLQLERATHLVVLISPGSERSAWVSYIVGFARAHGTTIVPYLTHPAMEVPSFLDNIRTLRDREGENELIQQLKIYRRSVAIVPSFSSEWDAPAARASPTILPASQQTAAKAKPANAYRDVFICHAGEDKAEVVRPLVEALGRGEISSWFAEAEILWGDSLTRKVNEGLTISRFVVVVLSKAFLGKDWPERELNAALNLEAANGEVKVLPMLVGTNADLHEITKRYPLLNDKMYVIWDTSGEAVLKALRRRLS